jgi:hypothetical protein
LLKPADDKTRLVIHGIRAMILMALFIVGLIEQVPEHK